MTGVEVDLGSVRVDVQADRELALPDVQRAVHEAGDELAVVGS